MFKAFNRISVCVLLLAMCMLTSCISISGRNDPTNKPRETALYPKPEGSDTVQTSDVTTTETGNGEYVFNRDDWNVNEYEDYGLKYIQIHNSGRHGRQSEIDYIFVKVYENEEDSKKAYKEYYNKSKDYDKGHWEEGDNWFISDEWGVMDASIVWMVYREGNMLIIADLAFNGNWIVYGENASSDGPEPTESTFKGYILNNVPAIKEFMEEHFLK